VLRIHASTMFWSVDDHVLLFGAIVRTISSLIIYSSSLSESTGNASPSPCADARVLEHGRAESASVNQRRRYCQCVKSTRPIVTTGILSAALPSTSLPAVSFERLPSVSSF
jgi:hypothetical protein